MFPYDNSRFPYDDIPFLNDQELDAIIEGFDEQIEYVTYFKGHKVQERLHKKKRRPSGCQSTAPSPSIHKRWHPASELSECRLNRILDEFTTILELVLRQRGRLFMTEYHEREQAQVRALQEANQDVSLPCLSDDGIWPRDVSPFRTGLLSAYDAFVASVEHEFHRAGIIFYCIESVQVIWAMQFLDAPVKSAWKRYQRDRVHTHTITWSECKTWLLQFADPTLEAPKAFRELLASSQRIGQPMREFAIHVQRLSMASGYDIPEPILVGFAWANALPELRDAIAVQLGGMTTPRTVADLIEKAEIAESKLMLTTDSRERTIHAPPGTCQRSLCKPCDN